MLVCGGGVDTGGPPVGPGWFQGVRTPPPIVTGDRFCVALFIVSGIERRVTLGGLGWLMAAKCEVGGVGTPGLDP